MCLQPQSSSHDCETARSYRILEKARQKAFKKDGYNSESTRLRLTELFRERFDGGEPRLWQLDVAEAIILGLDSLVIAGTGAGKTMPFMMPLMLDTTKKALVISPLKILQADQVELTLPFIHYGSQFFKAARFKKAKISAVAVNGESWNPDLLKVCKFPCLWKSLIDIKDFTRSSRKTVIRAFSRHQKCV